MKNARFIFKKAILICTITLLCVFCFSQITYANSVPVQKVGTYVLLENGLLVKPIGDSPNQTTKIIKENVKDFAYNTFLTVLLNDGTLLTRVDDQYESVVDTNVTQMINEFLYLKNGTIYNRNVEYSGYVFSEIVYSGNEVYAIDNNNTLYICYTQGNKGNVIKIAENVRTYHLSSVKYDNYIITKQNELLSFDFDKTKNTVKTNIIARNINSFGECLRDRSDSKTTSVVISIDGKLVKVNHFEIVKEYDVNNIKELCYLTGVSSYYNYYCKQNDNTVIKITEKNDKYEHTVLDNGRKYNIYSQDWKIDENNILYYNGDKRSLSHDTIIDYDVERIINLDKMYLASPPNLIYEKTNGITYVYDMNILTSYLYPPSIKKTEITFNGRTLELTESIQMKNERSMYPFRAILEAIGATVSWDSENELAIGTLNNTTVIFKINTNEYIVNGKTEYMDTISYVDNVTNRTYIPIRYVAEALGFNVDWTPGNLKDTISINSTNTNTNFKYKTVSYEIEKNNIKNSANLNILEFKPFMGLTKTMIDTTGTPSDPGIDTAIDAFSFVTSWMDNSTVITKLNVVTGKDNAISIKYGQPIETKYSGKEETLEMILIDKFYDISPSIIFTSGEKADEYIRNWFGLSGDGRYSMNFKFGKVHNTDYGYYLIIENDKLYQIPIIHKNTKMEVYYTDNNKNKNLIFDAADMLRQTRIELSESEKEKVLTELKNNGYTV